jgi:alpha-tubulin suppressor-like RCC1 family protein
MASGTGHTLALLSNGTVDACGSNTLGQLGIENSTGPEICPEAGTPCSREPVQVPAFKAGGVTAIAAGGLDSIALKEGKVWTWGSAEYGQLGYNTTETCAGKPCSTVPREVKVPSKVIGISAGYYHALAILENHEVVAWGRNEQGQLGNGTTTNSAEPVQVQFVNSKKEVGPLKEVVAVAAGSANNIALLKSGEVVTWGENLYGELGIGPLKGPFKGPEECFGKPCSTRALAVQLPEKVKEISTRLGGATDIVLLEHGGVMDWGLNQWGQLGNGESGEENGGRAADRGEPVSVCTLAEIPCKPEHQLGGVASIVADTYSNRALLPSGNVMAWGQDQYGQLGVGKEGKGVYSDLPTEVHGLSEVTALEPGHFNAFNIQNRPGPRFSYNGKLVGAIGVSTLSGGEITLENPRFGKIKCRALANGSVNNGSVNSELERGHDQVESFEAFPCTSEPACPGIFASAEKPLELVETEKGTEKVIVGARRGSSSLPWSGEIFSTSGTRRLKLERAGLTLVAPCVGAEVFFEGTLQPQWVNGVKNGLNPSHLDFFGAGQLVSSTGETLSLSGTGNPIKVAGESGFALITVE